MSSRRARNAHSNAPPNLDQHAFVAQRAIGQRCLKPVQIVQARLGRIVGRQPLEIVDRQVLVSLAFGIPEDRQLDCLDFGQIERVDSIFADEQFARAIILPVIVEHHADQRFDHDGHTMLATFLALTAC